MSISFETSGSFDHIENALRKAAEEDLTTYLNRAGSAGVSALRAVTPTDSGATARGWSYEVERSGNKWTLNFLNSHVNDGHNVAVLIQYGHGTRTGGYVPGTDYINPPMTPLFKKVGAEIWKAVTQ